MAKTNTAIVNIKELGTNCWLPIRFTGRRRCDHWKTCNYPEKKTCKAREAEIAYLDERATDLQSKVNELLKEIKELLEGNDT